MNTGSRQPALILAIASFLTVLLGALLYRLGDIPFGTLFSWTMVLFALSLSIVLVTGGILLFRIRRHWFRWLALFPWAVAPAVAVATAAVLLDVRVFYFQSLPPHPSSAEWVEDLRFLGNQMAELHRDLFALIPEEKWNQAVKETEQRIPALTEREILMEFFRLSALPNDNHSFPFVMAPCFDLHSFPLVVFGFPEGWYIVNAGRGYQDLIGSRLLRIGGEDVEEIYERYPLLLAAENEWSRRERFTYVVTMAEWLAYHGIIDHVGEAEFTFQTPEGNERILKIPSSQFNLVFRWSGLDPIGDDLPPVFTNPREDAYTYRMMADGRVLYLQLNQCINQAGRETAAEFGRRVGAVLAGSAVDRCIVDLRNNDGGDEVFGEVLRVLREDPRINRRGGLCVLIGRRTQSAAVIFAAALQMQTDALFLGEPTGQGVIFYGGPALVELPHSGLLFGVSRHFTVAGFPFDTRQAIEPDIPVPFGIEDFRAGRDPVLEAALEYTVPGAQGSAHPPDDLMACAGRYLMGGTIVMDVAMKEGTLDVGVTDFLPNTRQQFSSDLRWEERGRFATKIRGVEVLFPAGPSVPPVRAVLAWRDTQLVFERMPEGFVLAFELFTRGDVAEACGRIRSEEEEHRRAYPDLEQRLNRLGYSYLRGGETAAALEVFLLNVELFPDSYNVYDSYGEALMVEGKIDSAITNYRRSLELNPENRNAAGVIERLSNL